jgi:hypothetical protein
MKFPAQLFGLLSIAPTVFAHYKWPALIINGQVTGDWQYVRENTNNINPLMDLSSTDLRCNEGGLASGPRTDTAPVAAGSKVGQQEVLKPVVSLS